MSETDEPEKNGISMDEDIPKLPASSGKIHNNLAMVEMIDIRNDGVVKHLEIHLAKSHSFLQHQILKSHIDHRCVRLQVDMEKNVFSMIQRALTGAILRIASKF